MCIIAIKPKGIATPNDDILRNMFRANPDGAGVAYNLNNKLHIIKGLMTFEEFLTECKKIPFESAAIYHTRIQTSGGICKELTHPFLLDSDINKQRCTNIETSTGYAVAHNGIFNEFEQKDKNNDTTQFITNYLVPLKKLKDNNNESLLDDDLDAIINKLCGNSSKLAIINEKGDIKRYGGSWIYDNGIYYSNGTYERPKPYLYFNSIYDTNYWRNPDKLNLKNKIKHLKTIDPYFQLVYNKYRDSLTDDELIRYYENGWV